MSEIKLINLTKRYKDKTVVDNLNFSIKEGELFSLLGVNGAGKTTTIKMLTCLIKPTSGDASVLGKSILTESEQIKQFIGISPQESAVAPNLTVRENLEFVSEIYTENKIKAKEEARKMIEKFGMGDYAKYKAKTLSGGWQRRLSLAMALAGNPKILFLDEPTLGLDVLARRELWKIINELKGKTTILLTTHYMEEAESLSDRMAIMVNGLVKAIGTPHEIKTMAGTQNIEDAFVKIVEGA